jgi:iron-sulfur cluster assembly protein
MAKEENLDDVIADLVDSDDEEQSEGQETAQNPSSPFEGIDTASENFTGDNTVSLTERAARQVRKIISEEDLEENLYLRVAVEGGGCSGLSYKLGLDHKTEQDEVIESQGIEILVDPRHMMYLEGISIDYPDGLDARGFTFENPNASESCGCGSSFAI